MPVRMIDICAESDALRKLAAYGTSEGVTKAWDTRGRGRHPQSGKFSETGTRYGNGGAEKHTFTAPNGDRVHLVQDQRRDQDRPQRFNNVGERNVEYTDRVGSRYQGRYAREGNARVIYTPKGGSPTTLKEYTHENAKGDPKGSAMGYIHQRFLS